MSASSHLRECAERYAALVASCVSHDSARLRTAAGAGRAVFYAEPGFTLPIAFESSTHEPPAVTAAVTAAQALEGAGLATMVPELRIWRCVRLESGLNQL
jgi:hypothetical protein